MYSMGVEKNEAVDIRYTELGGNETLIPHFISQINISFG